MDCHSQQVSWSLVSAGKWEENPSFPGSGQLIPCSWLNPPWKPLCELANSFTICPYSSNCRFRLFWKLKLTFSYPGLLIQWKIIMENSSPILIQFALFTYKLQSAREVVKHHHACFLWPVGCCCPHVIWLHEIACNSISEQKPSLFLTADPISRFLSNQNQLWHRLTSLYARIKITRKIICVTIMWCHPP